MAVHLTRIYTKTGDEGTTALGDMSRVSKTDPRLTAYADVDEANSAIGVAIALGQLPEELTTLLVRVQNDLFDVGADLCTPVVPDPEWPPLRVEATYTERLEQACDLYNDRLEKLSSFILPGGSPAVAALHLARAIVRRAERSAVELSASERINPTALTYLNRLSDHLFVAARSVAAGEGGDVLWRPGATRGS